MPPEGKSFARLQFRLALYLSLVFFLLLIVFDVAFLISNHPKHIREHAEYAYSLTQSHLSDAIAIYDGDVASNIIRNLENDPIIYKAIIRDIDGITLSSFQRSPNIKYENIFYIYQNFHFNEKFNFDIIKNKSTKNDKIGLLSITVNSYQIFLKQASQLPVSLIGAALWTVLVIIIVSATIYFRIAKPITDLSNLVADVDLEYREIPDFSQVRKSTSHEIQVLCSTIFSMLQDISSTLDDKNSKMEGFRELSQIDDLTGIANRRSFFAKMALASSERTSFSIIYADIDRFKQINDQYGHDMGDVVICATVEAIKDGLRGTDFMARIGGEEFAIKLPTIDPSLVTHVAERVRRAVEDNIIKYDNHSLSVTISLGVCLGDGDCRDVGQMQKLADAALYDSKRAGRNRVSIRELSSALPRLT